MVEADIRVRVFILHLFFKINTTRSEINRNGGAEAMKGYTTEAGYNCFLHERNNKQRAASNY